MCGNLPQDNIMAKEEISVRITKKTYEILRKRGDKSIKVAIDKLLECSKTHIVQTIVGRVTTGNAGLTRKQKKDGYVVMLCTMDANNRCVDIAMTEKQMIDLKELLEFELKMLEN